MAMRCDQCKQKKKASELYSPIAQRVSKNGVLLGTRKLERKYRICQNCTARVTESNESDGTRIHGWIGLDEDYAETLTST